MDLTPQQELFIKYYLDPKSETFSNMLQSGLKAGYSQEYSESIGYQNPDWLSKALGKARKTKIIEKAEKNLEMALDGLLDDIEKGGKPIQYKATEFSLKTLKKEDYGDKVDITTQGEKITSITWLPPEKKENE
jgi:phage terminase small subunit